ncbi:hypothetical protein, partial [Nocardia tengchongensis]|uniref:hypothetical protein n=1 Tax=Nocardia tengchongensis TaxID=2055889 RepID=UPI0036918966
MPYRAQLGGGVFLVARVTGIEPEFAHWDVCVLPLHHTGAVLLAHATLSDHFSAGANSRAAPDPARVAADSPKIAELFRRSTEFRAPAVIHWPAGSKTRPPLEVWMR